MRHFMKRIGTNVDASRTEEHTTQDLDAASTNLDDVPSAKGVVIVNYDHSFLFLINTKMSLSKLICQIM
jgi:hypothetical protein